MHDAVRCFKATMRSKQLLLSRNRRAMTSLFKMKCLKLFFTSLLLLLFLRVTATCIYGALQDLEALSLLGKRLCSLEEFAGRLLSTAFMFSINKGGKRVSTLSAGVG